MPQQNDTSWYNDAEPTASSWRRDVPYDSNCTMSRNITVEQTSLPKHTALQPSWPLLQNVTLRLRTGIHVNRTISRPQGTWDWKHSSRTAPTSTEHSYLNSGSIKFRYKHIYWKINWHHLRNLIHDFIAKVVISEFSATVRFSVIAQMTDRAHATENLSAEPATCNRSASQSCSKFLMHYGFKRQVSTRTSTVRGYATKIIATKIIVALKVRDDGK